MGESQKFLNSVLKKHNPLSGAMGDLVASFDSRGDYIWSNPNYNNVKEAVCLEFLSDKGRVYYLEAERIFRLSPKLSDNQADFLWKEGISPWPLVSSEEKWEQVSWAYLVKNKHWRKSA